MTELDTSKPYSVIPARYESTRLPGKPLVPLLGTPMILWVARACAAAFGSNQVIVATDDQRIANVVREAGFRPEWTSPRALTGTDRVAEVAVRLGGETIVNVQGDEPLVSPEDIRHVVGAHQKQPDLVTNGFAPIGPDEDPTRLTIPKVVLSQSCRLLYASRAPVPGSKSLDDDGGLFLKQVCIYAYSVSQLTAFIKNSTKTPLELREDIEILRFLEIGQAVQMVRTETPSIAVDEPKDAEIAEKIMRGRGLKPH